MAKMDIINPAPRVIYKDNVLLVIDKPAGLLSIPDGYDPTQPNLRVLLEPEHDRLWIVHRLDKETSGVIVLARTVEAHRHLNIQFSDHHVEKCYHAIVVGSPDWEAVIVHAPLRANVGRRKRTVVDPQGGKIAITAFRVLEQFSGWTLIEARPKTGRPHQIRAHLYDQGYPICADPLYGEVKPSVLIKRLALHASALEIRHPGTNEIMIFEAPYPNDFRYALEKLRESHLFPP